MKEYGVFFDGHYFWTSDENQARKGFERLRRDGWDITLLEREVPDRLPDPDLLSYLEDWQRVYLYSHRTVLEGARDHLADPLNRRWRRVLLAEVARREARHWWGELKADERQEFAGVLAAAEQEKSARSK